MDQDFANHHQIPLNELQETHQVEVINGRASESEDCTHIAQVPMVIQDHRDQLPLFISMLGHCVITLGMSW